MEKGAFTIFLEGLFNFCKASPCMPFLALRASGKEQSVAAGGIPGAGD